MTLKAALQNGAIVGNIIDDQKAGRRGRTAFDGTRPVILRPQDGDPFRLGI